jgi:hypothetical protein
VEFESPRWSNDEPAVVRHFAERLAPPPDLLHQSLMALLMLDVCRHTFESLHASLPDDRCTCATASWSRLAQFTRWYEIDPRASVCAWTDAGSRQSVDRGLTS